MKAPFAAAMVFCFLKLFVLRKRYLLTIIDNHLESVLLSLIEFKPFLLDSKNQAMFGSTVNSG
jgi:hypothetical protein